MARARREVVESDAAPAAVGPYSQGIVASGPLLYTAGQIPLGPEGKLIGRDAAEQTEQVLRNLRAVLEAADSGLDQVVKSTIYLTDLESFGAVNEVYARFFPEAPPARSCVEVSALPKGALVEIEVVALAGDR